LFEIQYRFSNEGNIFKANIRNFEISSRNSKTCKEINFPTPKTNNKLIAISEEKKKDVKSMISWCPSNDRPYLEKFCKV
jgi:hypothetical protein